MQLLNTQTGRNYGRTIKRNFSRSRGVEMGRRLFFNNRYIFIGFLAFRFCELLEKLINQKQKRLAEKFGKPFLFY